MVRQLPYKSHLFELLTVHSRMPVLHWENSWKTSVRSWRERNRKVHCHYVSKGVKHCTKCKHLSLIFNYKVMWDNISAKDLSAFISEQKVRQNHGGEPIWRWDVQLGLWRYWISYHRGEAATNIAVWRLIARPPPRFFFFWRGRTCASAWSAAPARCRATAHCSRSQISLITWREAHSWALRG